MRIQISSDPVQSFVTSKSDGQTAQKASELVETASDDERREQKAYPVQTMRITSAERLRSIGLQNGGRQRDARRRRKKKQLEIIHGELAFVFFFIGTLLFSYELNGKRGEKPTGNQAVNPSVERVYVGKLFGCGFWPIASAPGRLRHLDAGGPSSSS